VLRGGQLGGDDREMLVHRQRGLELIFLKLLQAFGNRAHIVLGNGSVKHKGDDENAKARGDIRMCDVHDRMTAPRALAHNKFLVICDAHQTPHAVWTGSTNWTMTGLCTQANNAVLMQNSALAEDYLEWKTLAECEDASPANLLTGNATPRTVRGLDGTTLWFTATTVFDAELLQFCSHRRKPALENRDDVVADLGRREGDSVYKPTPTIDFIFGADDHLIGIAIHGDETLSLLDLLQQIIDGHGLVSIAPYGLPQSRSEISAAPERRLVTSLTPESGPKERRRDVHEIEPIDISVGSVRVR
jgi:hypothetical protein